MRRTECLLEVALTLYHDHAYPAPTSRRLYEYGIANLFGYRLRLVKAAHFFLGAGHHKDTGLSHFSPG